MYKILILSILIFSIQIAKSQPSDKMINSYFLKYQLYPISTPDIFVDPNVNGDIESIDMTTNDTINVKIHFVKNKVSALIFDSTKMNLSYRFGHLVTIINFKQDSIVEQTIIKRLFPFIRMRYIGLKPATFNDLKYTAIKGFNKINKIKYSSGFTTYDKIKIKYRKGRVHKVKNYNWGTVSQKCRYTGYTIYNYLNDTTVIQKVFDSNDSLAFMNTNVFDSKGNILYYKSLIKKRVTGWGIDASYYAYDGTEIQSGDFGYKFDNKGNWIEKKEYEDNKLKDRIIRIIKYKN